MIDWATVSALATAGGTLVLAAATFVSVRSANNAARAMERSLLADIRPVLMPSRSQDPPTKISFNDDFWLQVDGGRAGVEVTDDVIYFGIPMRNVGNGLAVLDRWDFYPERITGGEAHHRPPDEFRRLTRDLYVPAGDLGFWQGAFREPGEEPFAAARDAIAARDPLTIDVLYGDHEGGQRAITRFTLLPMSDGGWMPIVGRHWNLDRDDPR